mgnify:CR=1 FL=1
MLLHIFFDYNNLIDYHYKLPSGFKDKEFNNIVNEAFKYLDFHNINLDKLPKEFMEKYIRVVDGRFDVTGMEERLNIFIPITCLRGITWCAMAWVQYQEPGRLIRNEETFRKIESYLSKEFLDMIENRYYV